ncbi:hypothetical protein DY000_02053185 [Brassica cretica]|uniref:Uncharacterized protein n=1 Tax=Brassica cretica TaxID=69181 RepID=A0ABQ7AI45_BRACR|nr:hypothetical protein DY000_02053185 [Brassica cretica]
MTTIKYKKSKREQSRSYSEFAFERYNKRPSGRNAARTRLLRSNRALARARSLRSDRAEHASGPCVATLFELLLDVSCFLRKAFHKEESVPKKYLSKKVLGFPRTLRLLNSWLVPYALDPRFAWGTDGFMTWRRGHYRYLLGFRILPLGSWPISSFHATRCFYRKPLSDLEGAGMGENPSGEAGFSLLPVYNNTFAMDIYHVFPVSRSL